MSQSVVVTLGGTKYRVPRLNLGQLEEIIDAGWKPFAILRVALTRAKPTIADPSAIHASPMEIASALKAIMNASGLTEKTAAKASADQSD